MPACHGVRATQAGCLAAVLAALLLLTACGGNGSESSARTTSSLAFGPTEPPAPETTRPAITGTTNTTAPRPPRTTTTYPVDISGGGARITGSVIGPQGPVPNATVRVDRLLGEEVSTLEVSAPGGQFNLPSVRGGHYRMRAWRAPDFFQMEPEVFFLAADEVKTIDLRVAQVGQVNATATVEPSPPPPQEPFSIAVQVYAGSVSPDGRLQGTTRNGVEVQIVLAPGLGLQGSDRAVTDGSGRATFRVRCLTPGNVGADVVVEGTRLPLGLPPCPNP